MNWTTVDCSLNIMQVNEAFIVFYCALYCVYVFSRIKACDFASARKQAKKLYQLIGHALILIIL